MTFFIWLITLFIDALITTFLAQSGTQIGALLTILLYGCSFFIAKKACDAYKEYKKKSLTGNSHSDKSEENS